MKALLITKKNIDKSKKTIENFTYLLDKMKISFKMVPYDMVESFYDDIHKSSFKETFDVLISYGGDGTILKSARIARKLDIPILGINVGTLGFLTCISDKDDLYDALTRLKKKDYKIEKRFMLEAKVIRDKKVCFLSYAVNEATLTTSNICKIGKYSLSFGNENVFNEYKADGLIVATPTGSTAHSLSAGGPIVSPDSDCLIITAICPHAFNQRSIVVNGNKKVNISVNNANQLIDIDGRIEFELKEKDKVEISKLNKIVKYIKFSDEQFFNNLKNKIKNI